MPNQYQYQQQYQQQQQQPARRQAEVPVAPSADAAAAAQFNSTEEQERSRQLLIQAGIGKRVAERLAANKPSDLVREAVAFVKETAAAKTVENPPGLLVKALLSPEECGFTRTEGGWKRPQRPGTTAEERTESVEERGRRRLLVAEAQVNSQRLRRGTLTDEEGRQLAAAGDRLRAAKIFIDDSPSQGVLRIAANARRLKLREGIRLVVIDYLQLIEATDPRAARHLQVGEISRRLKQLSRELELPVVSLAQVNRESENRQGQRPKLSDLRESGSIEADSDNVLLLHRPAEPANAIELIIAKQRNGPIAEITLAFRKEYGTFENWVPA